MDVHVVTRAGRRAGEAAVYAEGLMTVIDAVCDMPDDGVYRLSAICAGELVTLGVAIPDGARLKFRKKYSKNALREINFNQPSQFLLVKTGEEPELHTDEQITETVKEKTEETENPPDSPQTGGTEITEETEEIPQTIDLFAPSEEPEAFAVFKPDTVKFPEIPVRGYGELTDGWREIDNPELLFRENGTLAVTDRVHGALARTQDDIVYLAVPVFEDKPFPMMPVFCFGEPRNIDGNEYLVFKIKKGVLTV